MVLDNHRDLLDLAPLREDEAAVPGASRPVVAIAHDYLTQRGGAERVVLSMLRAFPHAPLFTSLHAPSATYPEFSGREVRTSPIDRIPALRRNHRLALPLLAPAFSAMRIEADVVVCSSSGWAHGVSTPGRKIVYCHSPGKWLYQPDRYVVGDLKARAVLRALRPALLAWDRRSAGSADRYLANSTAVRNWLRDIYGIDAEVLPPPGGVDPNGPSEAIEGIEPGFMLCVSRLLPYKNVEVAMRAFASLPDQRLIVVGDGPQAAALAELARSNVRLLPQVSDEQLRWLYRSCLGLVSAAQEDFGLTPLEAGSFGKPAAVLRWGGFLDTVVEGETGIFIDEATPAATAAAISQLIGREWDRQQIASHASRFSEERFARRLQQIVGEVAEG